MDICIKKEFVGLACGIQSGCSNNAVMLGMCSSRSSPQAECLSNPSRVLKAWGIPGELLVFCQYGKPKKVSCDVSEGSCFVEMELMMAGQA